MKPLIAIDPGVGDGQARTDRDGISHAEAMPEGMSTQADRIRARATELAKGGAALPGFRLQERRGTRELADPAEAYTRTGLTPGQFVSACKVSLPKLADAFATARGMSKAEAAREVETKLDGLIREGSSTVSLVVDRGNTT